MCVTSCPSVSLFLDFRARQELYRVSVIHSIDSEGGNCKFQVQYVLDPSNKCSDRTDSVPTVISALLLETLIVRYSCWRCDLRKYLSAGLRERATLHWVEFFASRIRMLYAAIASAGVVCARHAFEPWESVRFRSQADILADPNPCRDDHLRRRNVPKNTCEWDVGAASVEFSAADDPLYLTIVRISNSVEIEQVAFWHDEPRHPCLPRSTRSISIPKKNEKRVNVGYSFLTDKKFSLVDSPPVSSRKRFRLEENPSFVANLEKNFEGVRTSRSSCDHPTAPMFWMSRRWLRSNFVCKDLFGKLWYLNRNKN